MPPGQYPNQMPPVQPSTTPVPPGAMMPGRPPRDHHVLLISLIAVSVLFVGAVVFAIWAFMGRQDYKNNVDQKVAAAVTAAKQQQNATDTAANNEANKYPLATYVGPSAYGSVTVKYPKTWSAYVDTSQQSTPVDAYFQPGHVPSIDSNSGNNFALRLQVLSQSYDQVVASYTQQAQQGQVKVASYKLANVPSVAGVMVSGAVQQNKQGVMIILPLRANTLELWTESDLQDFTKNILPNFTFSP